MAKTKSKIVLELRREYLDSGGYTKRGEYFGVGAPLYYWAFWNRETNDEDSGHIRAYSRADAKEQILANLKRRGLTNPGINGNGWTPIHAIRFNEDGSVSLLGAHTNPAKLGTGERFKALTKQLRAKGAYSPGGLARYIGVQKYGKAKFQELAAKGRRRAARRRSR